MSVVISTSSPGTPVWGRYGSSNDARQKGKRPSDVKYSSKIIKAGALLADTRILLSHWNTDSSIQENLERLRHENVFGKASRSRVEDILAIFRQRYLTEREVTKALVRLVDQQFPAPSLDRIFYFHTVRADQLLHDTVTDVLVPLNASGITDIHVAQIEKVLMKWVGEGRTKGNWSEPTIRRIAQGLLSTLRDFGILTGSVNKRIAPAYLPLGVFCYVAFFLKQHQPSGAKLLDLPDWRLFFLTRDGVERFLFEAHQSHLLEYHAAGTVTRLTFPVNTLDEYANVLTQRSH